LWHSITGLAQIAILITLKIQCLSIIVTVVDLMSLNSVLWFYHILVVNIVIIRKMNFVLMQTVISYVILEVAHLVIKTYRFLVFVVKTKKESHAKLQISLNIAVKFNVESYWIAWYINVRANVIKVHVKCVKRQFLKNASVESKKKK
jgi:hypothetical protein